MSNDQEINIPEVDKHIQKLKETLNKAVKAGVYDLEEIPEIVGHLQVFVLVTKRLMELQDAVQHMRRQALSVKKAESL